MALKGDVSAQTLGIPRTTLRSQAGKDAPDCSKRQPWAVSRVEVEQTPTELERIWDTVGGHRSG
jgi:hypothetical protein